MIYGLQYKKGHKKTCDDILNLNWRERLFCYCVTITLVYRLSDFCHDNHSI